MKVLYWHVYSLEVNHTQKALKSADDLMPSEKKRSFEDGVVCMVALEEGDDDKPEIFSNFYEDLKNYLGKVKASKVFIYPYAHLSTKLLKPSISKDMFYSLVEFIKDKLGKDSVGFAEFGWYKEFKVHVRGHPLAELSRTF